MNNALMVNDETLVNLPEQARTRSGVIFHPRQNAWSFRDSLMRISLNFGAMPASAELISSTKQVLLWYAENLSPAHLRNMFDYFLMFLRFSTQPTDSQLSEITVEHILNYRSSLQEDEYLLGNIKGFFIQWKNMGLPGIEPKAIALLKRLKLKGNRKGEAVLTMHPTKGPLTEIEWQALHSALQSSYEEGKTSLGDYLLAWLIIALGQRPIQYAALKLGDFHTVAGGDVQTKYFLRIPKAKQRGEILGNSYHERVLATEMGVRMASYVEATTAKFSSILSDPRNAPLFPEYPLRSSEDRRFLYHYVAHDLSLRFQEILKPLRVYSERTGQLIHITPKRLRSTYGTRMAAEGYGARVIAENLGHSDPQNVQVYTAATPAIIERIDRALAMRLAPLIQAFRGEIIEDESKATRASDPASRICDPRFGAKNPVGNCGELGGCEKFAPLACYTCRRFQPWRNGPHNELLQHLLDEWEILATEFSTRIASIQAITIFAIAEVVEKCEQSRKA